MYDYDPHEAYIYGISFFYGQIDDWLIGWLILQVNWLISWLILQANWLIAWLILQANWSIAWLILQELSDWLHDWFCRLTAWLHDWFCRLIDCLADWFCRPSSTFWCCPERRSPAWRVWPAPTWVCSTTSTNKERRLLAGTLGWGCYHHDDIK